MRKEQTFLYINEVRREVVHINGQLRGDNATIDAQLVWYPEGDETSEDYIFGQCPLTFPAMGIFANVQAGQRIDFVLQQPTEGETQP